MTSPSLAGALQSAVQAYERLYFLQGVQVAAKAPASLFHQSWTRMLWNTVYDAAIISIGALLDTRRDSHGLCSLIRDLRLLAITVPRIALIADLDFAVHKIQTPYLAIKNVRNRAIAHNALSDSESIRGPATSELLHALDRLLELLSRSALELGFDTFEIDRVNMQAYAERTSKILLAGMSYAVHDSTISKN